MIVSLSLDEVHQAVKEYCKNKLKLDNSFKLESSYVGEHMNEYEVEIIQKEPDLSIPTPRSQLKS